MSLCHQCARLTLAPTRNDVPIHLHIATDAATGGGATSGRPRVYDCETCDARWGWRDILGWYLETPTRSKPGI